MPSRIYSLDFLRGIAVLGILIINIESFAFPIQFNPYLYGFASELDISVRYWVYLLAQGKFFALFVMIFGISFYLMLERHQQSSTNNNAIDVMSRRLFFLYIFGVVHTYFIWSGDILHHYAVCGFFLLPLKTFSQKALAIFIVVMFILVAALTFEKITERQQLKQNYQQAISLDKADRTDGQKRDIWRWQYRLEKRSTERYIDKMAAKKGRYSDVLLSNWQAVKIYEGELFYQGILFDCLMLMALGILLYRMGIFSQYQSLPYYWMLTWLLFAFGMIMGYIKYQWWSYDYLNPVTHVGIGLIHKFAPYIQGLSYLLLINGLYQKWASNKQMQIISQMIRQVGQMAFSSYIFHSLICAIIFYGYGFNYHAEFNRSQLLWLILAIWFINIIACHYWLKAYSQGPLEFIWRKLVNQKS